MAADNPKLLDALQTRVAEGLKDRGFRMRGRTHNREMEPGLVQVIHFQAGQFPIGAHAPLPGFRPANELHGRFTVNLGVYIQELAVTIAPTRRPGFVQEYDCTIRMRLGEVLALPEDRWWPITADADAVVSEVRQMLWAAGLPYLDRFGSRAKVLAAALAEPPGYATNRAGLDAAVLLAAQGRRAEALAQINQYIARIGDAQRGHREYAQELAARMGASEIAPAAG